MSALSIGISGLLVSQRLMNLAGQNIANANTPNYHRQVAELGARVAGTAIGTGVEINRISRITDPLLEGAVLRNTVASNDVSARLDGLNQLQAALAPGTGSLHDLLEKFFNEAQTLTTQPDNLAQRSVVLSTANALADSLNNTADDLNRFRSELVERTRTSIDTVNSLISQIAQLNQKIHDGAAIGNPTNELLDQRDQLVAKLAELVDVRTVPQEFGQINVFTASTPLILNSNATALASEVDQNGRLIVHTAGATVPLDIAGGKIAGTLALHNTILPDIRSNFDDLARGLVSQIDHIHATGIGLNGPLTSTASARKVQSTSSPLASAGLHYPPTAGDLYITVTNLATGQRQLNRIAFDPATQSLDQLAAAITAVPNVQGVVDPQDGTLHIVAAPGYGFDFSGRLSTQPETQSIIGTTTAQIAGAYTGPKNDVLTFSFVGSGTIGSTQGLSLEVRNSAGTLLTTRNVGLGYEAGTPLAAILGVNVKIANGTVNPGDSFQVNVAANSDSAGLLTALGINSFFVGDDSSGLAVRQDLLANPAKFALSATGEPGDGGNLNRLVQLGSQQTMSGGRQTFTQYLNGVLADVATQVQDASTRSSAYQSLGQSLSQQLQSASGVDSNEELVRLIQYQRSYQMSAHFISSVNQTLDELFKLV